MTAYFLLVNPIFCEYWGVGFELAIPLRQELGSVGRVLNPSSTLWVGAVARFEPAPAGN